MFFDAGDGWLGPATPVASAQKFHRGDLVRVATDLGPAMEHFSGKGELAHIVGSYQDQYGGEKGPNEYHYTLLFQHGGQASWYNESQLTLVRHEDDSDMQRVRDARAAKDDHDANLDWIIANWSTIRTKIPSASLHALAALIGITPDDLWGAHGEGLSYHHNSRVVWKIFDDILATGADKALVLQLAERMKGTIPCADYQIGGPGQ